MNTAEQQQPLPQDGNVLGAAAVPVQGAPQLPPQMFTTAAQLLDLTDSRFSFFFLLSLLIHSVCCQPKKVCSVLNIVSLTEYRETHARPP